MTVMRLCFLAVALSAIAAAVPARAQSDGSSPLIRTDAPFAVIMDHDTGDILFEKNARRPMAPASMSKIMTALLVFEELERGALSLSDSFRISEDAWRRGGAASGSSTMFAEVGSEVSVEDLLRGMIIQSGNDAAIALAEGVAGSEEAFAQLMTLRAQALGLEGSTFRNATGWPDPEHRMTAVDLARLARIIVRDHAALYRIYAERSFSWNGITQGNRNPLLGGGLGVDGLKTGHTEASGYGLVLSASRNGVRRIVVVNGLDSEADRADAARQLLEAAFRQFERRVFLKAGTAIADADVWMGRNRRVPITVADDLAGFVYRPAAAQSEATLRYRGPLPAPVAAGDPVGDIIVERVGFPPLTRPAVAAGSSPRLGPLGVMLVAIDRLLFGTSETVPDDG